MTDAIWQFRNDIETPFGNRRGQQKGKGWKLERLMRQAWPGTWQKQVRQRVEAAGLFSGPGDRCHLAVSKRHRNTIWQQTRPAKGQRVEAGEACATGMARNVAKAGAAKGGSCRVVFQALVTDAIWQFRNDIESETPFGNRPGQENAKGHLQNAIQTPFGNRRGQVGGSWRGLGDRRGQECGRSRRGKDGSCRQQTRLATDVARPRPMSHTCGDPRRRPA